MSIVIGLIVKDKKGGRDRLYIGYDYLVTDERIGRRGTQPKAFLRKTPTWESTHNVGQIGIDVCFGVVGTPGVMSAVKYELNLPEFIGSVTEENLDDYVLGKLVPAIALLEQKRVSEWGLEAGNFGLLIGMHNLIWSVDWQFNAVRFDEKYDAIGSSGEMALAALDAIEATSLFNLDQNSLATALQICIKRDVSCGGGFGIIEVPPWLPALQKRH